MRSADWRIMAAAAVKEDSPMKRGLKCDAMTASQAVSRVKEDSPMKRGLKCMRRRAGAEHRGR